MFKVIIDNGVTYLFQDDLKDEINNSGMMGFLINREGIKELISSFPIRKYYISTKKGYMEITKEKAMFAYDKIVEFQKEEEVEKQKNK